VPESDATLLNIWQRFDNLVVALPLASVAEAPSIAPLALAAAAKVNPVIVKAFYLLLLTIPSKFGVHFHP